jgi:NADPH-dependent 2,4-dienoyl-CoA reductase/sulfur reductase-like enzyme
MKFLIIGADAAGMSAASRAKRTQPDMDVRVLEKTGDVSYSACGMPYNIADSQRDIDDLVVRPAEVFRQKQGIDLLTGHEALQIDPIGQVVTGVAHGQSDFSYSYDHLLIATGGRPVMPERPGFDLPGVMALKSLADGRNIKHFIRDHAVEKAVIIGMGYIGLEMAEALRGRGITVDMIKPNPILLPWMADELAAVVQQELDANGVRLHLGQDVTAMPDA